MEEFRYEVKTRSYRSPATPDTYQVFRTIEGFGGRSSTAWMVANYTEEAVALDVAKTLNAYREFEVG